LGRGRPLKINWRASDTHERIAKKFYACQPSPEKERLAALLLLRLGESLSRVGEVVGRSPRTIQRWIDSYHRYGLPDPHSPNERVRNRGRPPKLSRQRLSVLIDNCKPGEITTVTEAIDWVEHFWEVTYSHNGMRALLQRNGDPDIGDR
jgi:transposase